MGLTRRQFIQRTGLATAASFFGPSLFRNPLLRQALADTIGDRYFISVYLDGGNDGLNTITPIDNGSSLGLRAAYQAARNNLRLPTSGQGMLLAPSLPCLDPITATPLGFHPGYAGLKNLYDLGKVAVVQGCGYPDYSLSHDSSRAIWETANPLSGGVSGGWMGRYLAANYGGTDIPAVNIRNEVAGDFAQTSTSVLALRRLANFSFPYDDYDSADDNAKQAAFQQLSALATGSAQPLLSYIGNSAIATETATQSYPALVGHYNTRGGGWSAQYNALDSTFARDMREVARVIYGVSTMQANVNARFFEVVNGGYDTHSGQGVGLPGDSHYDLHREVGDAIELFYQDLVDMGVANKVCLMIWSEFGRRVEQNGSGTDHGSQAPVFVIGGSVIGGVYGRHPNINESALDENGNTVYWQGGANPDGWTRSTDLRDIYGTLLQRWLGMTDALDVIPVDGGDPTFEWTAPNFNLGFLP